MVAEKEIENAGTDDIGFDDPFIQELKLLMAEKLSGIVAEMVVESYMNKIRIEEPYLIYTQQERL